MFCGRRSNRMKGLLWMGIGFLLLYKRFRAVLLHGPEQRRKRLTLHRNSSVS
ncbi:IS66 family insertion sequence element accessory protein TnpB [Eisenbergiella tayi]|uniref:IS66 family insertion sequence element accessory protein TnpB n=1 Tax=Eisenbergiella tayi TaxID=1432052 RepID=UPI0036F28F4B